MQHIVRKQILELKLSDQSSAFHVQDRVSNFYWKKIIPELEKIFDLLSGKEIIHLDKLEIELGILDVQQLESTQSLTEICPGILARIKEAIQEQLLKRKEETSQGIAAQWLYYMEHGYLNWNTITVDAGWYQQALEMLATDYGSISSLRKLINNHSRALTRIALRHDDVFLQRLAEVLTAEKQGELVVFVTELQKVIVYFNSLQKKQNRYSPALLRNSIWKKILAIAATGQSKRNSAEIIRQLINWVVKEGTVMFWVSIAGKTGSYFLEKIVKENKSREIQQSLTGRAEPTNRQEDEKNGANDATSQSIDHKKKQSLSKHNKRKDEATAAEVINKILENDNSSATDTVPDEIEEGVFIDLAGLVLVHPFLAGLFKRLALTEDNKFITEQARQRSLYILYYLATGKEGPEEFELVISKFLLGYPLEETVPSPVKLTDKEKEEAGYLLEAAIEQWSILGASSPAALREGFLQRKGKLFAKNGTYYLQVEAGPIDMLLDHLPWNLGIIKLPWMKGLLRVEWR